MAPASLLHEDLPMATEARAIDRGDPGTAIRGQRPYARSWLDVFFAAMTALPGPTWLAYLLLIIPSVLLSTSALWLSGLLPFGQPDATQTFWGVSTAAILAAAHHLRNVAGSAFDQFRPALGDGVAEPERARYELTVMPAVPVAVITVFTIAITPAYLTVDPELTQSAGLSGAGLVARIASEGLTSAIFLAVTVQALRQLRIVTRLHAAADQVDPFRPLPLYAFSGLTAQVGVVIVAFVTGGFLANPDTLTAASESTLALWLPWLGGGVLVGAAVFVLPMLGMHGRLEVEKDRLENDADARMRGLLAELDDAIDARDRDRVGALDGMVSALRHQREVLAALPTWPWSTATVRGFASALLLPIGLFLVQRYLGDFLGG